MPQIDLNAWRENIQGCQIGGKNVKVGESAFPTPCTSCICSNEGVSLNTYDLYVLTLYITKDVNKLV